MHHVTEYAPAKTGEYPVIFANACCKNFLKDNKDNSLQLVLKICSDICQICAWTLSVPQSSQFPSSFALRKLFASQNRQYPWTNIWAYFCTEWRILYSNMTTTIIVHGVETQFNSSFLLHVVKPKTKQLLWSVTTDPNSTMNQSEFEVIKCNQYQAVENVHNQMMILVLLFCGWERRKSWNPQNWHHMIFFCNNRLKLSPNKSWKPHSCVWRWLALFIVLPSRRVYGQNKSSFHCEINCSTVRLHFLSVSRPVFHLLFFHRLFSHKKNTMFSQTMPYSTGWRNPRNLVYENLAIQVLGMTCW